MSWIDEPRLLQQRAAALQGDDRALEALILGIKDPVFRLSLRMLGQFADAEDATQEILVKVVTALAGFDGRSRLGTWVYSIAANHLRDFAQARATRPAPGLDAIAQRLEQGLAATQGVDIADPAADPLLAVEARETELRCTQAMLMALDVDQRLALVLCEIFGLDTATAAQVLAISPAALRQRLSRGRRTLEPFMQAHCGLHTPQAPCRCERQAVAKRCAGRVPPIEFARDMTADPAVLDGHRELKVLGRLAVTFRRAPEWAAPQAVVDRMRQVIGASRLLGGDDPQRRH